MSTHDRTVRRPTASGFGLLELLTTLLFLIIVLGVIVSLSRFVRLNGAAQLTRGLLTDVEIRMQARSDVTAPSDRTFGMPTVPSSDGTESDWQQYALASNRQVQQLLGASDLVADAWGHPLAYLPRGSRSIGTAPQDRAFCVSPGPDGLFLTQEDNLFSYEQLLAATQPVGGGHRE